MTSSENMTISKKTISKNKSHAPKSISILGVTGSIGQNTLSVIGHHQASFIVEAVAARRDAESLAAAVRMTGAKFAAIADETQYATLKSALSGTNCEIAAGEAAIVEAAARHSDLVVAAIMGTAGLKPTLAAIERGASIALANKEVLVSAGAYVMARVREKGATLLPLDSEHNALFQALGSGGDKGVEKLTLTASGGPFRNMPAAEMKHVTRKQALAHPNWSMGAKISIDSATMMNKGLELIEAHHLFALPEEKIDVLVHPQSIVHGMVHYADGSVLAGLAPTDMRTAITHCLHYPERVSAPVKALDFAAIGKLDFWAVDDERFPALSLARQALRQAGGYPNILNAANEVAVNAFLEGQIGFTDIALIVAEVLAKWKATSVSYQVRDTAGALESLLFIDHMARNAAHKEIEAL